MFNPGAGFHEKWTKLISWNFVGAGFHEKWTKLISRNFAGARFYDKYCISNKERCPIAAATGACRRGCILKATRGTHGSGPRRVCPWFAGFVPLSGPWFCPRPLSLTSLIQCTDVLDRRSCVPPIFVSFATA
jgi:hypothetical protein